MNPTNRRGFWIATAFLLAFGVARVLTMTANAQQGVMGEAAPAFDLPTVSGDNVTMKQFEGKVVVLDFWAVWCGPCKKSMPFFQMLSDKYKKDGLEVIGLHVEDRTPPKEKVAEYLNEIGVSYTNVMSTVDNDNAYMVYAMPTTYIVDRKGVIQKRHIGFNPDTAPAELEELVREMLGLH